MSQFKTPPFPFPSDSEAPAVLVVLFFSTQGILYCVVSCPLLRRGLDCSDGRVGKFDRGRSLGRGAWEGDVRRR